MLGPGVTGPPKSFVETYGSAILGHYVKDKSATIRLRVRHGGPHEPFTDGTSPGIRMDEKANEFRRSFFSGFLDNHRVTLNSPGVLSYPRRDFSYRRQPALRVRHTFDGIPVSRINGDKHRPSIANI